MAEGSFDKRSAEEIDMWLKTQTFIPLGMMIETAALLGIDAGPMEGFDPEKVNEILGLPEKNLKVSTMIAFGYRGDDKYAEIPKTRRDFSDAVEII
jgi:nitroreductase